jgi:hypothetical protein
MEYGITVRAAIPFTEAAARVREAHRALAADRRIGPLLPCNVVVRTGGWPAGHRGARPADDGRGGRQVALRPVADEAASRLREAALDCLRGGGKTG